RAKNIQGLLVEGVEPFDDVALRVKLLEAAVEAGQQLVALLQVFERKALRQRDAADLHVATAAASTLTAAAAFDAERVVRGTQVAGVSSGTASQLLERNVRRNALVDAHQASAERPERGILQCRR